MDRDGKLRMVEEVRKEARSAPPADIGAWRERALTALRVALGQDHPLVDRLAEVYFGPNLWSSQGQMAFVPQRLEGLREAAAVLDAGWFELLHAPGDDVADVQTSQDDLPEGRVRVLSSSCMAMTAAV